ncbi:MAG: DUF1566 domain-containing protein, partial [Fusobacterium sp.]|nr:DUF1566 domain-containing protein [Fusobacterium sp.]
YARMSQAISLMPAMNGYGTLDDTTDTAAETFITAGLSKVLKINNICDSEHLSDCGIPESITNIKGDTKIAVSSISDLHGLNSNFDAEFTTGFNSTQHQNTQPINTKAAAFETTNGESILTYYNPKCISSLAKTFYVVTENMCANFIYDLNGSKGPNTFGKDIGIITVLYPTDSSVVAPIPLTQENDSKPWLESLHTCTSMDSESRLPNVEELIAMSYNNIFIGCSTTGYWSGSVADSEHAWAVGFDSYVKNAAPKTTSYRTRCVKR